MKLRAPTAWLGTVLTVGAAFAVTAQALSMPPKPHRARDIVSTDTQTQARFADVCRMYPAECRFNADGTVARVVGRRIVSGTERAVLEHFKATIVAVQDGAWDDAAPVDATSNPKD